MFCEEIRLASQRRPPPSQGLKVSHSMPTRHLTDAQRQGFARFDGEPSADQLARYFHLDQTDRDLVGTLRGDHNRLGFAVMLTSARFLGAFPVSLAEIPASVLAIVIEQLALEPGTGVDAYFEFATGLRPTPLNETFGVGVDRLFCGRRRRGGRFLYGAAEPVFELDPGRLDHPHWSQGAVTPPEHVV